MNPGDIGIIRLKNGDSFTGQVEACHGDMVVMRGGYFFDIPTKTFRNSDVAFERIFDGPTSTETYVKWKVRSGFAPLFKIEQGPLNQ